MYKDLVVQAFNVMEYLVWIILYLLQ
jgi:hypothetical protein